MGRTKTKGLRPDIRPLIRHLGWQEILRQTGLKELIEQVGVKPIIDHVGLPNFLAALTPQQRQEVLRLLQMPPTAGPNGSHN